jgi:hypothetical protein
MLSSTSACKSSPRPRPRSGTIGTRGRLNPANVRVEIVPVVNRPQQAPGTIKPAEMLDRNCPRGRPLRGKEIGGDDFPPAGAKPVMGTERAST